ncbi:MAG TPA: PIG-L family deacetylase [Flavobacteriales bacterium]|nr:PIG-L family deacetylase [Flavobacteriales bacterium]
MKRLLLLLLLFCALRNFAQTSPSLNSAEILLGLQKLNTVGSVLYIAAHPDDENTRLLSYLASERKLRTGYLSITRGDGGQNLIGKEQGEALGLIRTNELLQARKHDGAEQFFTRANDFGYSKTPGETFTIWNKDSVLADMVWVIRKFKPDVVICRFPTTGEGGHGHHTASAILAGEAFDAAADPKRYAHQLKYVSAWQVKRLFWNTFNFGGNNTTAENQLKLNVGAYSPLLGKGHGEIAAESRSMHKSQGFGAAKGRGNSLEYFKQLKGDTVSSDLFEGIDQTWLRLRTGEKEHDKLCAQVHMAVDDAIQQFDFVHPEKSVPALAKIWNLLKSMKPISPTVVYWKQQKLKELETLLLASAGLWMEAYVSDPVGVPGTKINLTAQFINRNGVPAKLLRINYLATDTVPNMELKKNELYTFKRNEALDKIYPLSNPYWLNYEHSPGLFKLFFDPVRIGEPLDTSHIYFPFTGPAFPYDVRYQEIIPPKKEKAIRLKVMFSVEIAGIVLNVYRPPVFKSTDPVKGEVYRPFEVLPPATVNFSDKAYLSVNGQPVKVKIRIKANKDNVKGKVIVKHPYNWTPTITPDNSTFNLIKKGEEKEMEFMIAPVGTVNDTVINALLELEDDDIFLQNKSITRIEYDHIPYQFILSDAKAKLVRLDLKKTDISIGYIPGAGDDVMNCLKQIGYAVTELTDDKLASENLSKYNAIVTGVRAYNTDTRLQVHYDKLMRFVEAGGNLIVQYNTNSRVGPLQAKIGPYPFTISRERVTDENASVGFLKRSHPVISSPNQITQKDFEGWVQERGIYFATEYGDKYETIFRMNDPGENPMEGSLIYAHYGKGNFVYTGLAFFRQLPAGVPGAYRLFVNLLSLPKSK